jgi:hypothetical protein
MQEKWVRFEPPTFLATSLIVLSPGVRPGIALSYLAHKSEGCNKDSESVVHIEIEMGASPKAPQIQYRTQRFMRSLASKAQPAKLLFVLTAHDFVDV